MLTIVDFVLHVKSKHGGHRFLGFTITSKSSKIYEYVCGCVCVCMLGDRYRSNAAPKPNLPILQFC